MENQSVEFAKGRYINSARIVQANVYQKDGKIRIAIDLDTKDEKGKTVYSDECATLDEAHTKAKILTSFAG